MVYVIDISGSEERDPLNDFEILQSELKAYDENLLKKPFLVALNKIDLENAEDHAKRFKERWPSITVFEISALQNLGLEPLIDEMRKMARPAIQEVSGIKIAD